MLRDSCLQKLFLTKITNFWDALHCFSLNVFNKKCLTSEMTTKTNFHLKRLLKSKLKLCLCKFI